MLWLALLACSPAPDSGKRPTPEGMADSASPRAPVTVDSSAVTPTTPSDPTVTVTDGPPCADPGRRDLAPFDRLELETDDRGRRPRHRGERPRRRRPRRRPRARDRAGRHHLPPPVRSRGRRVGRAARPAPRHRGGAVVRRCRWRTSTATAIWTSSSAGTAPPTGCCGTTAAGLSTSPRRPAGTAFRDPRPPRHGPTWTATATSTCSSDGGVRSPPRRWKGRHRAGSTFGRTPMNRCSRTRPTRSPRGVHDCYVFMAAWFDIAGDGAPDLALACDFHNLTPGRLYPNVAGQLHDDPGSGPRHRDQRHGARRHRREPRRRPRLRDQQHPPRRVPVVASGSAGRNHVVRARAPTRDGRPGHRALARVGHVLRRPRPRRRRRSVHHFGGLAHGRAGARTGRTEPPVAPGGPGSVDRSGRGVGTRRRANGPRVGPRGRRPRRLARPRRSPASTATPRCTRRAVEPAVG